MVDPIALLQSLTLPAGAISGKRIFLDGDNGIIQIFDASNTLVGQIDSTGVFSVFDSAGSVGKLGAAGAQAILVLDPTAVGGHTLSEGYIFGRDFGGSEHVMAMTAQSPAPDLTTTKSARMSLQSDGLISALAKILLYASHNGTDNATADVQIFNNQLAAFESIRFHVGGPGVLGTTDINGFVTTITHNAGFTPRVVELIKTDTALGAGSWARGHTDTYGATTFRGRFIDNNGASVANTSVSGAFVCYP